MRRVFTHLTSGWQTGPFIHGERLFSENPDCPTLVDGKQATKQQKFCPNEPGVARDSFFLFFLSFFILLILLIEFIN